MAKRLTLVIDDEHGLNAYDRADVIPPDGLERAVAEGNGNCSKFVFDTHDIQIRAMRAERKLEKMGLPKTMRKGFELRIRPEGPWAKAYKYSPASRQVLLRRTAKGWMLVEITESRVHPQQNELFKLIAPNAGIVEEIKRRAVVGIEVKKAA